MVWDELEAWLGTEGRTLLALAGLRVLSQETLLFCHVSLLLNTDKATQPLLIFTWRQIISFVAPTFPLTWAFLHSQTLREPKNSITMEYFFKILIQSRMS
ncbi:hypothetical protein Lalb_Chr12g0200161 [Lupinus albus]|uniref:Uncharacterized protein n=1 Tax=Lupinus albus TaxID=3870 RepID=A0A6A4PMH2_LUPAL|nr:hypothetical protein Lalb_Chr12g0200161 [Lupinus albus]